MQHMDATLSCVCPHGWAVEKCLNRSICHLGADSCEILPREGALLWGHVPAHCEVWELCNGVRWQCSPLLNYCGYCTPVVNWLMIDYSLFYVALWSITCCISCNWWQRFKALLSILEHRVYSCAGIRNVMLQFPTVKILTSEVHPSAPTHFGQRYFGTD